MTCQHELGPFSYAVSRSICGGGIVTEEESRLLSLSFRSPLRLSCRCDWVDDRSHKREAAHE
jgi:hypothetical protein